MRPRAAILCILSTVLAVSLAWAGGSGLNVIVVVNQNSTKSVQLGNDYCELRGVPPQNVLRLTNWTGGSIVWSPGDFRTNLLSPLLDLVATQGVARQAQFVLLSMDIPYRIQDGSGENSTTSALFYGFKTNTVFPGGPDSCSLPDQSSNSYAYSELPFVQSYPNTATTNSFLAMMLTDTNLAAAENTLRRGVLADSSFPTQAVYLAKTSDQARNVRFLEFDNSIFDNQVAGNHSVSRLDTDSTAFTNLAGLMTGLANYSLGTNMFVPGGVGDTLTSFAGQIFDNSGQTPLLAFLEAGAAGSYGTVVEPCNYPQKFPDPIDYFYQFRGFALAEAYYQSVLNPFEGLFVGEPLSAPFAHPGSASWSTLTNGSILNGPVVLSPSFASASTNLPLAQADLFVDGVFLQTMTNLPPTAGNILTVVLNGITNTFTVPTNATVAGVAAGLAGALNLQSNLTQVVALPAGDRVELQSQDVYVPGSNVAAMVSTAAGSAPALTTRLAAARPTFLDTMATGYQLVTVYNTPAVGDWLQVTFMKTNGVQLTFAVTNSVLGTTVGALAQNLASLVNASPPLQSADGLFISDMFDYDPFGDATVQFYVYARTSGWPAAQIIATWNVSTNFQITPTGANPLADNVGDLRPRNHLYISSGSSLLAPNFVCDTTQLSDGYHEFAAVAYEGTSVRTQTRVARSVLVQNGSLTATLASLPGGSNATLGQQLQFIVTPNATNISRIELFSTGGSQGFVTNQPVAGFAVSASYLGLGLHPFYAVVTDQAGHRFRTTTSWYRIIPAIPLTLTGVPPSLTWPATPGCQYEVQLATNLAAGFNTVASFTATNSLIQWPVVPTNRAAFYRVKLDP